MGELATELDCGLEFRVKLEGAGLEDAELDDAELSLGNGVAESVATDKDEGVRMDALGSDV